MAKNETMVDFLPAAAGAIHHAVGEEYARRLKQLGWREIVQEAWREVLKERGLTPAHALLLPARMYRDLHREVLRLAHEKLREKHGLSAGDVLREVWEDFGFGEEVQMAKTSKAKKRRWKFWFEATNDPRKGVPFVARLKWKDGKIQREFYNLDRTWGKRNVTVSGEIVCDQGDVIEVRTGGSWKNDYRYWYLVHNGNLWAVVPDWRDSRPKMAVKRYLAGRITIEELLKETNAKKGPWKLEPA